MGGRGRSSGRRKVLYGTDGREDNNLIKLDWLQFQIWQRWDEFPEQRANPPMTVDMQFWYMQRHYYLDRLNQKYVILNEHGEIIASDERFLKLLCQPIEIWGQKSFQELIDKMLFVN